jgi:hypothetical protein
MHQAYARRSKRPRGEKQVDLVFTGRQAGNRIEILVNGTTIPLSCCSFQLLVDFVVALVSHETGTLEAEAVTVCRLRAAIDDALGAGAGKRLIVAGMKHRYRLTIPRTQMRSRIKLTACFFELVDLNIVSAEQAGDLRGALRILKSV